jgi:hypothetical protein
VVLVIFTGMCGSYRVKLTGDATPWIERLAAPSFPDRRVCMDDSFMSGHVVYTVDTIMTSGKLSVDRVRGNGLSQLFGSRATCHENGCSLFC